MSDFKKLKAPNYQCKYVFKNLQLQLIVVLQLATWQDLIMKMVIYEWSSKCNSSVSDLICSVMLYKDLNYYNIYNYTAMSC